MGLKEEILKQVSEIDIYEKYLGEKVKLGKIRISPLRKEKNPSFNIYQSPTNNRIYWKDFGDDRGDCFEFVMELFEIGFKEAIDMIASDFNVVNNGSSKQHKKRDPIHKMIHKLIIPQRKNITIKTKVFSEESLMFWNKYKISPKELAEYNVVELESFTIDIENEDGTIRVKTIKSTPENPIFCYNKHGHDKALKTYRPKEPIKGRKFLSNLLPTDGIFGYQQIIEDIKRTKRKLFTIGLCAGEKDCISLFSNTGIRGICLNSESSSLTRNTYLSLFELAENVVVLYDNDETGKKYALKLKNEYLLPYFDLSQISSVNDVSEYFEKNLPVSEYLKKFNEICQKGLSSMDL